MSELDTLIQLLAKLPGLGPRSARRAALHLIKRRESLLEPLAAALAKAAEAIRPCPICGNLDTVEPCAICRDPRTGCDGDLRRRGPRRSLGARAHRRVSRPLSRAGRDVVGARRHRPGRSQHRAAARAAETGAGDDPGAQRDGRGPDYCALYRRSRRRARRQDVAAGAGRADRRRTRLSRRGHPDRRPQGPRTRYRRMLVRYFLASRRDRRADWRPAPRPSPIFLANSERCSA